MYNSSQSADILKTAHTYTPVFTVVLLTIAKRWKQPKCPQTDEWIEKMWYIHDGILSSPEKE